MDFSHKYDNPNPEETATVFSKLFYCWLFPLFKYGCTHSIGIKDLYNTTKQDCTGNLVNRLERNWKDELNRSNRKNSKPSLTTAIRSTFIKPFVFYGIMQVFQTVVCRISQPVLLAKLTEYFEHRNTRTSREGWILAVALLSFLLLFTISVHDTLFQVSRIGMQSRAATSSLIYRKLLRLNKSSMAQTASGQVLNLLTNDVIRFDMVATYLNFIWIMPLQVIVACYFMYQIVGIAAVVGILALILQTIPLQSYLSRLRGKLRMKIASHTDKRVQLMSEIVRGIRVIKMYSWEKPFEKIVTLVRKLELGQIAYASYIWGAVFTIARFTDKLSLFITLITYVFLGNQLTADKVFSMVQFFVVLQLYMAILFPIAVSSYIEAKVSIKRIEDFLMLDETSVVAENQTEVQLKEKCGTIKAISARASWTPNAIVDTLTNVNLHIKPGLLYAIIGPIGAGKSSLLKLFLKELPILQGKLEITGGISYTSQEPWLFASSVRNNILFGLPYEESKYKTVIRICALERDLQLLPEADNTLVGERGTGLSGGQRARINLARSMYRDADIYFLDDPLSSVDAHVSKHLFEECIIDYLKNKTRILVTHQLQFLKNVDQIITINNAQIEKVCTYAELTDNDLEHLNLNSDVEESIAQTIDKAKIGDQRKMSESAYMPMNTNAGDSEKEPTETQELMEKGNISTSLYVDYFRKGNSIFLCVFTIIIIISTQICNNAIDLWLARWTIAEEAYSTTIFNGTIPEAQSSRAAVFDSPTLAGLTNTSGSFMENAGLVMNSTSTVHFYNRLNYIYVYLALLLGTIILVAFRSMTVYKICLNASNHLHNKMYNNVIRATVYFFDKNPSGRILNRFSKDLGIVDEQLPRLLSDAIQILSIVTGILMVVFIVTPWMIGPTVVLAILFFVVRKVYLASAQNIKRMEGSTKAPVLSHVSATIDGLTTIRVWQAQAMIAQEFDMLQDLHNSAYFLFLATCEAFGFYLDVITFLFTSTLIFQFLIFDDGSTLGANIGLAISQSMALGGLLQYGMRQTAEVSNQMISVERIMQYTRLGEEKPFESHATKKPHRDWPKFGKIVFKNLTLQYGPNEPMILKHLNVEIEAGAKVGVVGRTGAGKSSLIAALFRLAPTEGSITVDDIDINDLGLNDLRTKISIIPQEPILFTATIRYNLDPLERYGDELLWKALEDVELKDQIEDLNQNVSEGGSNFSVGQRQLLCLARAILQNNKILVMDEATANVDLQTDQLIQATIRKNFKNCTVITIAHRLNTVMDSDKILVMDAGEIVEYGHSFELLQDPNGYLSKMLRETGLQLENQLRKLAEDAYSNRIPSGHESQKYLPFANGIKGI